MTSKYVGTTLGSKQILTIPGSLVKMNLGGRPQFYIYFTNECYYKLYAIYRPTVLITFKMFDSCNINVNITKSCIFNNMTVLLV